MTEFERWRVARQEAEQLLQQLGQEPHSELVGRQGHPILWPRLARFDLARSSAAMCAATLRLLHPGPPGDARRGPWNLVARLHTAIGPKMRRGAISKLEEGISGAIAEPQLRQNLVIIGLQPAFMDLKTFPLHVSTEDSKDARVIEEAKTKTE